MELFAVRLVVCARVMAVACGILRIARAAAKALHIAACRVLGERRHRSWCSPQMRRSVRVGALWVDLDCARQPASILYLRPGQKHTIEPTAT